MNTAMIGGLLGLSQLLQKEKQGFASPSQVRAADTPGSQLGNGLTGIGSLPSLINGAMQQAGPLLQQQAAPPQQQAPMPQGAPPGLGSTSRGIFDQYMSQIYTPKYTPPPISGIYGTQPGGYQGFFAPQMPKPPAPAQQPTMNNQSDPSKSSYSGGYDQYGMPLNWHEWLRLDGGMGPGR